MRLLSLRSGYSSIQHLFNRAQPQPCRVDITGVTDEMHAVHFHCISWLRRHKVRGLGESKGLLIVVPAPFPQYPAWLTLQWRQVEQKVASLGIEWNTMHMCKSPKYMQYIYSCTCATSLLMTNASTCNWNKWMNQVLIWLALPQITCGTHYQ